MHFNTNFNPFRKKLLPLLLLCLFLYITLEIVVLYFLLITQVEGRLVKIANRVIEDIVLKNGTWDVSSYNADDGVSDENPLYVVDSEGFVIERSRPIHGLLDLSRYGAIAGYSEPQTLTTITNERWRVFSVPLLAGDKPIGIIMVANYEPEDRNLPEIDAQIKDVVDQLRSNILVNEDSVDVSRIDIRRIPFNTSFQIVNRFNKVLLQSHNSNSVSRIPSFIDRSYIENQLRGNRQKQVEDTVTHKKYLTLTIPVLDEKKLVAGIVVVGEPVDDIYWSISIFALSNLLMNILLTFLAIPMMSFFKRFYMDRDREAKSKDKPLPKSIIFMKKTCKLVIDRQTVEIPYASFQYYFCDTLFQKPKKKWEADEILEAFGEDFGVEKWRKVYDTMVALDKKTSSYVQKLFMVKDKRYFINPQLLPFINYVNS